MVRKSTKSLVRRGTDSIAKSEGGSSVFLPTIKDGETTELVPMINIDELPSADVHEFWEVNPFVAILCTGTSDCPGEEAGNDPRFRAYLPVITKEGEYKIFTMGIQLVRDLDEIDATIGGIAGKVIRFKRRGSGFNTRYSAVPTGKTLDLKKHLSKMPDVEAELGPQTVSELRAILVERELLEDVEAKKPKRGRASKTVTKVVEDDAPFDTDDDDDADDDVVDDDDDGDWDNL